MKMEADHSHLDQARRDIGEIDGTSRIERLRKYPTVGLDEIGKIEMDPILWYVDGMVPEGLTLLGARSKAGKSFFALQMAASVAEGKAFLGRATKRRPVLYCSLEMGLRGLKGRKALMGLPDLPSVRFMWEMPSGGEGLQLLKDYLIQYPDTGMVIIDVLALLLGNGASNAASMYRTEYRELAPLRQLAEEKRVAIVGITHMRKGAGMPEEGQDGIADLYGGGGVSAVPNAILTIRRAPVSPTGVLGVTLRDAKGFDQAIRFEESNATWSLSGEDPYAAVLSGERKAILQIIRNAGGRPIQTKDIAQKAGLSSSAASQKLKALEKDGYLVSPKFGFWVQSPKTP